MAGSDNDGGDTNVLLVVGACGLFIVTAALVLAADGECEYQTES